MFKFSNAIYNLRNKREFVSDYVKTVYFGTESHSYVGPKNHRIFSFGTSNH